MSLLSNIRVVPDFPSNIELKRCIHDKLAEHIDIKSYYGHKPPPKIIVFRPSGRPGDEFSEHVTPLINQVSDSDSVYFIVAFSGQAKDITELIPYDLLYKVKATESIFIQSGHLLPQTSYNYSMNENSFRNIAHQIRGDFNLKMPKTWWQRYRLVILLIMLIVFISLVLLLVLLLR